MSSDLVDNAVILFATAKSQGEAKDIALAVVDVYSEIATAERVSGSANLGYIVEKPWLDRPWKIILASVLGLSLAGALILMRADKAPGR